MLCMLLLQSAVSLFGSQTYVMRVRGAYVRECVVLWFLLLAFLCAAAARIRSVLRLRPA